MRMYAHELVGADDRIAPATPGQGERRAAADNGMYAKQTPPRSSSIVQPPAGAVPSPGLLL